MTPNKPSARQAGTSPSASGPAGALFEGQVAAHYLLTMLAEADPRGYPGISITSVELQRAGEGYPLDDVIVRGVTPQGEPATLEIQVKRTITFAPGDAVFKSVIEQLAEALEALDITHQRHQFAVATERNSFKIAGPYQDVLRWAREVSAPSIFFGRINRKGVGNDDMRTFVETVRVHLKSAGGMNDDETVWQILRRLQILAFDYDAPGSQSIELAIERARNLLDPTDSNRASALWKVLTEIAIRVAASGGDLDRTRLVCEISGPDGFRLRGSRRNRLLRDTLAEAAALAAADLRRSIAGISLTRSTQLDAVRISQDLGRYVEIRGGPGVGKSGLLGLLVDQVLNEGRAIVLTPERTTPGGWLAFKAELQIEGRLESFLSDLASDGGAVLFVDSIDFFADAGKRATVTDLVRAAASVPAFQVIVTARMDFGTDEPNWLPSDALTKLVRAQPVVIEELKDDEVEELKAAAPNLSALLADDHPASAVARNLFRLSRLLEVQGPIDQLRSEVDLLERWWTTADGPQAKQRERKRLLSDLVDVILAGGDRLEARNEPSVIDSLIASGTLRELALDRLMFRHDVLRDWGIAARLHETPDTINTLPLSRTVPATLARGIELGARFALERSENGEPWKAYLTRVSGERSHPSWRRWSILAILRSERAFTLLDRAFESLTENDGALLRELIRTTLAVESRPLVETLAEYGAKTEGVPPGIFAPSNGSWTTLVQWLLARRANLPLRILPDVVELFQSLSASMFFADPITPKIAVVLADWLDEIEDTLNGRPVAANQQPFASAFRMQDLQKLATDIRLPFFLMASRVPERAQKYLRRLLGRRNTEYTIRDILKFRGTLAHAAPAELVDITLAGLIPTEERERRSNRRNEAFTYLDSDFLPTSPAQGPFLDLLNAAPENGLGLIRRLVDHAIRAHTNGRDPGTDGFTLVFPTGPRFFPRQRSYFWSRQADGAYAVESSLLALEAWAHARIERGDAPEQVIADVLGPEGSPAAFLLVAVDILISHWPTTRSGAIPFLSSPELLSVDRTRQIHDQMPDMDLGGWGAMGPKEPVGPIRLADLKKRPSRRYGLERLLWMFGVNPATDRDELHGLLAASSARLGPPEADDNFADPRFMARYAINLIDPANWPFVEGSSNRAYVSPPQEAQHIEGLQKTISAQTVDFGIDAAIQNVLEDKAQSTPELAERAVAYAQRLSIQSDTTEDVLRSRTNTIVSAAMILTRDGSDALLDEYEGWARDVFVRAFASKDDITVSRLRKGIRFNPVAIAALGVIHLWRRRSRQDDRDTLLELAGRDDPHAVQGFDLSIISEIEPRLVPSLLRCALVAQVQPTYKWKEPAGAKESRHRQHRSRVAAAIHGEVAWPNDAGPEPDWPVFPGPNIAVRQHQGIRRDEDDAQSSSTITLCEQLCSQSAALWVRQLTDDATADNLNWLLSFVDAYFDWTAAENGAGLGVDAEIEGRNVADWNGVFLPLLARSFAQMAPDEAAARVVRMVSIPDKSVFDVVSELAPAIDRAYFNGHGLDAATALRLRAHLTDRLMDTAGWRWELDRSELSVEIAIGPAIAALFFNDYNSVNSASCYLLPNGIAKVDPFLQNLERLIEEGPVPFCSQLTLKLLEVSPRPEHLPFFLSSALVWLQRQPTNSRLWVDAGLGARMATWLEGILRIDTMPRSHPLKPKIDDVLARLVQVGVAHAHRVEALLATGANHQN
jgi:hypothetical protein